MSLATKGTVSTAVTMQGMCLQNVSVRYKQCQRAHHHLKGRPVPQRAIWGHSAAEEQTETALQEN